MGSNWVQVDPNWGPIRLQEEGLLLVQEEDLLLVQEEDLLPVSLQNKNHDYCFVTAQESRFLCR